MERRTLFMAAALLLVAALVFVGLHVARQSGPGQAWTPIPAIQGAGSTSPLAGQRVITQGVVTLLTNNGFFLQDPAGDGDPRSSDAVQVFTHAEPVVRVGQLVRLAGLVAEFNTGAASNADTAAHTVTQLRAVSGLQVVGGGQGVEPVLLRLPVAADDDFERFEAMLVTVPGVLTVSQNHFLGRYGQLTLSSGGRLQAPTNRFRPGPQAQAMAVADSRRVLLLDDGNSQQNPNPVPHLGADNTVRAGDTLAGLTGVLDYGLATSNNAGAGLHKIHPSRLPAFTRAHPREATPPAVGGDLKIASLNLLNYFTTLNNGRQACAPGRVASDCRGARSETELLRQQAKIVATLAALDADVVGLMEVENNGATAVQHLVDALNRHGGAARYAAVPDPPAGTGADAIRVAMIYQPGRLQLVQAASSDPDPIHNRPPLAQTFMAAGGHRFGVVVSHFKSKGCADASGADRDQGDLQACFNARRVQQARALAAFVAAWQAGAGTADVLLIGDFNAHAREDPIQELLSHGFVDQIDRSDPGAHTYVFDGQAGRLDHVFASASLSRRVNRAAAWHINADEPALIDYRLAFKPQDLYTPTPYRSSDHDPLVVGLRLAARDEAPLQGACADRPDGMACANPPSGAMGGRELALPLPWRHRPDRPGWLAAWHPASWRERASEALGCVNSPVRPPAAGLFHPGTNMADITLYGISNCDTVKKARAWLAGQGAAVTWHDFKKQGVPTAVLARWIEALGWEKLLNRQGTTWRKLDDNTKAGVTDAASATVLMQSQSSVIRRPVVEWGDGRVTVGFAEDSFRQHLG